MLVQERFRTHLLLKTNYNIISLDNYETGTINNHVKSKKVKYLKGDINEIDFKLKKYSDSIILYSIVDSNLAKYLANTSEKKKNTLFWCVG